MTKRWSEGWRKGISSGRKVLLRCSSSSAFLKIRIKILKIALLAQRIYEECTTVTEKNLKQIKQWEFGTVVLHELNTPVRGKTNH